MAVLTLALLLPWLGAAPFDDPGEGQHAEIAREVAVSGDWLTLRLAGVRYFDKPPLLYWLIAAGFKGFGVSELVARFPAVLGAAAAVAGTTLLGARLLGPGPGILAGAALLSCALFAAFGRYVRPETLFVAAIQWGFTGLLLGLGGSGAARLGGRLGSPSAAPHTAAPGQLDLGGSGAAPPPGPPTETQTALPRDHGSGRRSWAVVGCAALGVAALAKDVIGLAGPLAAIALALALAGRLRPIGRWLPAPGLAALLVLGLGWYALASMRNPGFLWYTVVDNHLLNAVQLRRFPDEDVSLSSLGCLLVAGLGALPWTVTAVLEVGQLARRRAWRIAEAIPWVALAVCAVALALVFTLSAFKLPHYGLPAYPAIALLAARWWSRRDERDRRPALWHLAMFALLAAVLGAAALTDGRAFMETIFSATDVYSRKEAVATQVAPLPAWPALRPLVGRTALVFALGASSRECRGGACIFWRPARDAGSGATFRRGRNQGARSGTFCLGGMGNLATSDFPVEEKEKPDEGEAGRPDPPGHGAVPAREPELEPSRPTDDDAHHGQGQVSHLHQVGLLGVLQRMGVGQEQRSRRRADEWKDESKPLVSQPSRAHEPLEDAEDRGQQAEEAVLQHLRIPQALPEALRAQGPALGIAAKEEKGSQPHEEERPVARPRRVARALHHGEAAPGQHEEPGDVVVVLGPEAVLGGAGRLSVREVRCLGEVGEGRRRERRPPRREAERHLRQSRAVGDLVHGGRRGAQRRRQEDPTARPAHLHLDEPAESERHLRVA